MTLIYISIPQKILRLYRKGKCIKRYPVSTAKAGIGEVKDTFKTPRGWHKVCEKFGEGLPENTVFVARKPTGETYAPELKADFPGRDWMLTRLLWLEGMEPGYNAGGDVDTRSRYIYIHGMPDDASIEENGSHGCIRMRNAHVIELFEEILIGTPVYIAST